MKIVQKVRFLQTVVFCLGVLGLVRCGVMGPPMNYVDYESQRNATVPGDGSTSAGAKAEQKENQK